MTNETKLKTKLRETFKARFPSGVWISFVANMMQTPGIPDNRVLAEGRRAWVEAKVDDNWLEKSQKTMLPLMARHGERITIIHADMRVPKNKRTVQVCVFSLAGAIQPVYNGDWDMLSSGCLWDKVLGIA